jgi:5-methylcytosine-specific restriction endonuclease McrA
MYTPKMVLLLNADYMPLNITSFKKAYKLIYKGKAEVIEEDDMIVYTPKSSFNKPSVIRLKNYVYFNYRKVTLSKINILKRDNFTCAYCGAKNDLTVDHILPRSRGGSNTWENLVTCCGKCNSKKNNKTPEEAKMPLLYKPYKPNFILFISKGTKIKDVWRKYMLVT